VCKIQVLRRIGGRTAKLQSDVAAGRATVGAGAAGQARRITQAQDVSAVGGEVLLAFQSSAPGLALFVAGEALLHPRGEFGKFVLARHGGVLHEARARVSNDDRAVGSGWGDADRFPWVAARLDMGTWKSACTRLPTIKRNRENNHEQTMF